MINGNNQTVEGVTTFIARLAPLSSEFEGGNYMNALKELYEHYTISEEYAALGTIPEMAFKEIENWAKQLSKEDYSKL